jgi:signal transduction histidine kinase
VIHPLILFTSAAVSFWLALHVRRRNRTPGSTTFVWLLVAIGTWCLSGAAHWAADSLDAKIAWARVQYLGIASVPALSLTFALRFAGSRWARRGVTRALIWIVPVLTVVAAWTNDWHGALWPSVTLSEHGLAVYDHGWWFWVATAHAYVAMLLGTVVIGTALRRSPLPYRGQFVALLAGAILPWAGNLVYVGGLVPIDGLDVTPLMFTASGALFTYALYRNRLFDLVPVARHQLVDSLMDAVVVIDASRRVLDMNAAGSSLVAQQRIGARVRWFGRNIDELLPFLEGTPLSAPEGPRQTEVVESAAGETRYYDVRVTPVRVADNEPVAWAVLLRDITDQHRAECERQVLEQRVQEQQKHESLSVLAAGVAHDFNNLLAGILGNADLLAMQVPRTGDMPAHVGAIILGAQRAADLVSKMLAYAGERKGASETLDLDALIREMLELLQASVTRHCTLQYDGAPVTIFADPVQIRQVVMNLIINAAEAVGESDGNVTVCVGVEHLSPRQLAGMHLGDEAAPGAYAFLDVRDNGPGMDDATVRRIFTPFYTTKPTGHGLGLAAVQGIVRGHRGALRVETQPGAGTQFRVWFPLVEQGQAAQRDDRALPQRAGTIAARPSSLIS